MKALKIIFVFVLVLGLTVPAAGEVPDDIPDFGTLYGDLYVILRDVDGVPILSGDGCIQPISSVTDSTVIVTERRRLDLRGNRRRAIWSAYLYRHRPEIWSNAN